MRASVVVRNEGPGRNIEARVDNCLFFGGGAYVGHVHSRSERKACSNCRRVPSRTAQSVREDEGKFSMNFKYFDRLESLDSALRYIQLEVDS